MAGEVTFYEDDGVTELVLLDLGALAPGEDYHTKHGDYYVIKMKNTSGSALTGSQVEIQQVGTDEAYQHIRIAKDGGGGTPGTFVDHTGQLDMGAFAIDEVKTIWVDAIVPLGATTGLSQQAHLHTEGAL